MISFHRRGWIPTKLKSIETPCRVAPSKRLVELVRSVHEVIFDLQALAFVTQILPETVTTRRKLKRSSEDGKPTGHESSSSSSSKKNRG
jgi:hypothetical protein